MPFQKGNTYGNRPKPNNRRPRKQEVEVKKAAAVIAREYIESHVDPFLESYRQLVAGRMVKHFNNQTGEHIYDQWEIDAPTVRHAIDKLLPDGNEEAKERPINITFVKFGDSIQLSSTRVSTTVLASNGQGNQKSLPSVASAEREGQGGIKFHNFTDVS